MFTRDAKRVHLPIRIGDVRFGSLADISRRSTSALPPKADMCGATRDVCCGPIADIQTCLRQVLFAILRTQSKGRKPWVSHYEPQLL